MKTIPCLLWIYAALVLGGCSNRPATVATPTPTETKEEHKPGTVHLTDEQIRQAGIEVQPVQFGRVKASGQTTGTVQADPDLEVKVGARVPGIVRSLEARVGDPVSPGQLLATLDSPQISQDKATYHNAQLEFELARKNLVRRTKLAKLSDASRAPLEEAQKEMVRAESALKAARAQRDLTRSQLSRYESLLRDGIASRQQVEEARSRERQAAAELVKSQADLDIAKTHLTREQRIQRSGYVVSGEVWEAETMSERTGHAAHHAREQLEVLGGNPDTDDASVSLFAPIRGIVTERKVARGERVDTGQLLFTLVDTSRLWVLIDLFERDGQAAKIGTEVRLWPTGQPKDIYQGRISYLASSLDPSSRTLRARVVVANHGGRLRPNMFTVVEVLSRETREGIVVPKSAVLEVEKHNVVYIAEEGGRFKRRTVTTGAEQGQNVEVLEGLKQGEKIVVKGTFSVKSEDLKSEMGED